MVMGSANFYPIVGALVGLGAVAIEWLLRAHLPAGVARRRGPCVFCDADRRDARGRAWRIPSMDWAQAESGSECSTSCATVALAAMALGNCLLGAARWAIARRDRTRQIRLLRSWPRRFSAAGRRCRWPCFCHRHAPTALAKNLRAKFRSAALVVGSVLALGIVGFCLRAQHGGPGRRRHRGYDRQRTGVPD